jgi:hypothetical protein
MANGSLAALLAIAGAGQETPRSPIADIRLKNSLPARAIARSLQLPTGGRA